MTKKWAFLLGSPDISGGSYVIFEHAIRARRRGVDVAVITERPVAPRELYWHPEARELSWKTFDEVVDETFDVVIATWWRTVFDAARVRARTYAYFVQSIESWFYPESERTLRQLAGSTYLVGLPVITEATWIATHLSKTVGTTARLVRNGIRKEIYTPDGEAIAPRQPGRLRVLVEGALHVPFKNVERTLGLCKQSKADEVWLMTPSEIAENPGVDRVFSRVPIFETPKIYRSCDVIVKLSYVEGMFGPPLEMFHCGGTAITYDVTGHDEYLRHEENALIAPRDDEALVVSYINRLRDEPELLARLKAGAEATARGWQPWEESSQAFQAAVEEILEEPPVDRAQLMASTRGFMEFYSLAEDLRKQAEKGAEAIRLLAERKLRVHFKEAVYWMLRHEVERLRRTLARFTS